MLAISLGLVSVGMFSAHVWDLYLTHRMARVAIESRGARRGAARRREAPGLYCGD